jgi:hypothetical protein
MIIAVQEKEEAENIMNKELAERWGRGNLS